MDTIKRIDIHAHITAFPELVPAALYSGGKMVSAEELLPIYDKLNIEKGVLLPLVNPEAQCVTFTSENCKIAADRHPDRFLWFCGIDPRMIDNNSGSKLSHLLNHYKNLGAKGCGELTAQLWADDPMMDNLFSALEENDMPLTIHIAPRFGGCYGIVDELGLPRLERMLKKHPNLRILGHSQPFWAEIADNADAANRGGMPQGKVKEGRLIHLLREYPNLLCDLSAHSGMNALRRDPEFAAKFIEEFSDRIFYGCDVCTATNNHQYQMNDFLTKMRADGMISEENYFKLMRGNACRLLGLEP
ncbi:MAG: hypothetical protein E7632_10740 [Ruminococcaceae bacterium]|nr:hypothetical protein [Oscillospiraceae bacterium]